MELFNLPHLTLNASSTFLSVSFCVHLYQRDSHPLVTTLGTVCTFIMLTDFPKQFFICNFTLRLYKSVLVFTYFVIPFVYQQATVVFKVLSIVCRAQRSLFSSPPCHNFPRNPLFPHAYLSRRYVPDENSSPSILSALHFNDQEDGATRLFYRNDFETLRSLILTFYLQPCRAVKDD